MKKVISTIICLLLVVGFTMSLAACGTDDAKREQAAQESAAQAAYEITVQKLETIPYSSLLIDYALDDFQFTEMQGDDYLVRGTYTITYGFSPSKIFFNATLEEDFVMKLFERKKWKIIPERDFMFQFTLAEDDKTTFGLATFGRDLPEPEAFLYD